MNLYQIDDEIERLLNIEYIDPETGEIIDDVTFDLLNELAEYREVKIENVALYIKNLQAQIIALKSEEDKLKARRTIKENKVARLTEYLTGYMISENIEKVDAPRVKLSFRTSRSVQILNENVVPRKYKVFKRMATVDKRLIKTAIESGVRVKGASILIKENLQIK